MKYKIPILQPVLMGQLGQREKNACEANHSHYFQ